MGNLSFPRIGARTHPGLVTQIMAEKICLGGGKGGLVRKRVRLEKNTTLTQSFYKYLHSQSTTSTGAGYIRKEGRKPRGREKSRRNREKKEGRNGSILLGTKRKP